MSQANVEIVRRAWRAYEDGDLPTALADIDRDFVATRVPPMPDVMPYYGREGMMQMLADWIEDFSEFNLAAEEFVDANPEHVVVRIHQRGVLYGCATSKGSRTRFRTLKYASEAETHGRWMNVASRRGRARVDDAAAATVAAVDHGQP